MIFLASIPLSILTALWAGFALSVMWDWFAVPAFGAPAMSVPVAAGVVLMVRMLTFSKTSRDVDSAIDGAWLAQATLIGLMIPTVALGLGAILKMFV